MTDIGLSIGIQSAMTLKRDGIQNGLDNDGYEFSLGSDWGSIRTGGSTAGVSATLMDDH